MVTKEYSVQIKFKKQALFKSKQAKKTHWWVWDWWLECGSAVAFDTKLMGGIPGDTLIFWRRMIPLNCCLLGAVFLPGKCLWQQLRCLCAFITCLVKDAWQRGPVPEVPLYASLLSSAVLYLLKQIFFYLMLTVKLTPSVSTASLLGKLPILFFF